MAIRLLLCLIGLFMAAAAQAMPPVIYVVRHLHTPEGQRDPDLTEKGRAVAQVLPRWFRGKALGAIYLTDFRRTRQTAAPLAAQRGLSPKIYNAADTPALVVRVRAETQPVLIVGHSNTVPDIVQALGGTRPAPLTHPDFGDIWTITARGSTRALLPGAK